MKSRADQSTYSTRARRADGKSMHGRIVGELGLMIVSGELQPGDRLPGELQLLDRYEVSRPVLREAVRVLVAKGLVVSRQRAGAIVRPRGEWHLLDPDVLCWLIQARPSREFMNTLLEVRRIFEPAAAALAARSATEAQVRGIEQDYADMVAATDVEQLLEPDLAFHRHIAEATNNDLLAYIGNMLSLALRESFLLSSQLPDMHQIALPRHLAILAAIRNRDPLGARQATLVQLQTASEVLASVLATQGGADR
ncbi:GntR family transcriptional regulator [Roseateles aquatilis]|uniref:GntR family transcriptional regulator n=1 Tax=Roseateles aquatilis TaxID=431061 RepID=A0A246IVR4_9BURK|nr:FadR/GntR family transcriptional regulator [Roseateles aquatilis]OWQ84127.1 GntR family transcriptional regulator [Roseateles aquatilis]